MTDETNGRNQKFKEILRKGRKSGKGSRPYESDDREREVYSDCRKVRFRKKYHAAFNGRSGQTGRVFIDGEDIFKLKDEQLAVFRRKKIGFIFQDYNLLPSLNVWENIVLPLGLDNKKVDHNYVMEIIKTISIEDKLKNLPNALSGGQKQRVAIARALASRPSIILADEPTGNLDSRTELEVIALLKTCVTKYGQTLVMITHDETIAQMADEIIVIEDGKVVTAE